MSLPLVYHPDFVTPLPPEHPLVQAGLKLLQRELGRARSARSGRGAEPASDVDPAVLQRLRGLGYVGGGEER